MWEFLKCQIRSKTISYSILKQKMLKQEQIKITSHLSILEKNLDFHNEEQISEYTCLKRKWENFQNLKTQGAILRSKAKFVEEGEKNSKYFLNLEKRNYNEKYMKSVINSQGLNITDATEILNEQAKYYKGLYTSSKNDGSQCDSFFNGCDIPQLSNEQKMLLDNTLTLSDITDALKEMANDKSPGLDGFTTNFYKFFWMDIKSFLYDSYRYSIQHGELSDSQRRGLLSLIPKVGKDLRYLKSWRPVTLLATDYKILAKALATRLQKVISDLVNNDQVGYIKGRYIGENVRIIEDMMIYTSKNKISGFMVLIDYEKAFDMIEWDFLFKTLCAFNFGSFFIKLIRLLYNKISSCTINNGFLSQSFQLSRGIRQGCPISALLFVLVAEILSIKLRSDINVKGILVGKVEYKICQLADDTTIFIKNLKSLQYAISHFQNFQKFSGLKLNLEKSEIIPLGPNRANPIALPKEVNKLLINYGKFKTLGVWFSHNFDESMKLNYEERLSKIEKLLQIWKQRSLSWKGRIMIIKTLILSQITHLLSMIYTPPNILEKLDKLLFNFLWNDKPARVKRETIIAVSCEGGLKMPDVFAFHNAQKAMWIKRYHLNNSSKWRALFKQLSNFKDYELDHKLSKDDLNCKSSFHHQVLHCWFNFKSNPPNNINEILNEYIFLNKYVQIGHKSILPSRLGLESSEALMDIKIKDFLNSHGKFMSPEDINNTRKWKVNILHLNSLLSAIPRTWVAKVEKTNDIYKEIPRFTVMIRNCQKQISKLKSQDIYWEQLKNVTKLPTAVSTWVDLFPFLEQINWGTLFTIVNKVTSEPYLQSFQYKIINRTLNCYYNLFKWNISDQSTCDYCPLMIDTIEHHLYYCDESKNFWHNIENYLESKLKIKFSFTICEVIFGMLNTKTMQT